MTVHKALKEEYRGQIVGPYSREHGIIQAADIDIRRSDMRKNGLSCKFSGTRSTTSYYSLQDKSFNSFYFQKSFGLNRINVTVKICNKSHNV